MLALWVCGCAAYDSRWLQQRQERKKRVEDLEPARLGAARSDELGRVMRLRVHATPRFIAETPDWKARVDEMVQDANGVLTPALKIRATVFDYRGWNREGADDDLATALVELEGMDAGEEVDWVVGFVGSIPRIVTGFSNLGRARMRRKHFVLRAINNRAEYDVISQMTIVSESERAELLRNRKRHKAAAVMLHEIGHTLGAVHVTDGKTIMRPKYDAHGSSFAGFNLELMRLSLEYRAQPVAERDTRTYLRAVVRHLEKTRAPWVGSDRDEELASLRAELGVTRGAPAAPPKAPEPPTEATRASSPPDAPGLTTEERAIFAAALALEKANDPSGARDKALPLFSAHPKVIAVQHLRCRLATAIGLVWHAIKTECEPFRELTGGSSSRWFGGAR